MKCLLKDLKEYQDVDLHQEYCPDAMKVKSESEVAQSCPTLSDPMDCSPPGSSVHGIFQARTLEWGATAFSKTQYGVGCHCLLQNTVYTYNIT